MKLFIKGCVADWAVKMLASHHTDLESVLGQLMWKIICTKCNRSRFYFTPDNHHTTKASSSHPLMDLISSVHNLHISLLQGSHIHIHIAKMSWHRSHDKWVRTDCWTTLNMMPLLTCNAWILNLSPTPSCSTDKTVCWRFIWQNAWNIQFNARVNI